MDMEVLKKKISTFRSEGGRVRITDSGLLMEILAAWEEWTGQSQDFYKSIGVSQTGMASIIGRAKKLRREGQFPTEGFKEVKIATGSSGRCPGIEMTLENGKIVRFAEVDLLVDFLKKVA